MVRRLLRAPILRTLVPRVTAPLLPVSRGILTNAPRATPTRLFSQFPARLEASRHASSGSTKESLSQRLKHLIKSYGWYALGVYIIIGVLDFGIAFAAINLIGAQQVSHFTNSVKEIVLNMIHSRPSEPGREDMHPTSSGYENGDSGGLYAMLVLAYTVHKTLFVPVRVGLTAWLTPRLVGWLRQRGWAGGAGTKRAALEIRQRLRSKSIRS